MNRLVKQKWVERLRSGNIVKTTGTLRDGSRRCALGVLADVAVERDLLELSGNYSYTDKSGFASRSTIPKGAAKRLGLTPTELDAIVKLNDSNGLSFDEIADYVENNL